MVVWHQTTKFNLKKINLINFLQFSAIKSKKLNQIKKYRLKKCRYGKLWKCQPKVKDFNFIYILVANLCDV